MISSNLVRKLSFVFSFIILRAEGDSAPCTRAPDPVRHRNILDLETTRSQIRCSLLTSVIRSLSDNAYYLKVLHLAYSNLKWIVTCNALSGRCFFLATLAVRSSLAQHNSHTADNIESRVEVRLGRVTSSDADLHVPTRCPVGGGGRGVDLTPVTHGLRHIVSQHSCYQSSVSVAITSLLTLALPPASPPPPTVWVQNLHIYSWPMRQFI